MRRIREFFEAVVIFAVFAWSWRDKLPRASEWKWIRMVLTLPASLLLLLSFMLLLQTRSAGLRPLRRFLWFKIMDGKKRNPQQTRGLPPALGWEFIEGALWDDVVPVIWVQPSLAKQVDACLTFAEMYLRRDRFEEAQNAAVLAEKMAEEWLAVHPDEAHEARQKLNDLGVWSLSKPATPNDSSDMKEARLLIEEHWASIHAIYKVDGGMTMRWRNARVAMGLMQEIERRHKTTQAWDEPYTRKESRSLWPHENAFNRYLARRIGLSSREFHSLFRRVTKWEL